MYVWKGSQYKTLRNLFRNQKYFGIAVGEVIVFVLS